MNLTSYVRCGLGSTLRVGAAGVVNTDLVALGADGAAGADALGADGAD